MKYHTTKATNDLDLSRQERLILMGYRGSIAHGTKVDGSLIDDIDLMGVYIAPPEFYYGFGGRDTIEAFIGEYDIVLYELRKYLSMCCKFNPNAISLLYTEPKHIHWCTDEGNQLKSLREALISRKAYHAFRGYAVSQFKQLEKHSYHGYQASKRQELVEQFGYDTKHASHLIRLLIMGHEILTEGKVLIDRSDTDAQMFIDIKQGKWTFTQVKMVADAGFRLLDEAYEKSTLPEEPDYEKVLKILRLLIHEHCNTCMSDELLRWCMGW